MVRYKKSALFLLGLLWCFGVHAQGDLSPAPLNFVDPIIGTGAHGHTYPGATVPFGLVQLSPDTDDTGWDWCSGYHYQDSTIMGFSHTHLSGTGISDMADVLIMPYVGKVQLQPGPKQGGEEGFRSRFTHKNEWASPGYYAVKLDKHDIFAELTATQNTGVHRYTFPATDSARILIDLQHGLDRHRSWLTERVLESAMQVIDSVTIAGYRISSGWANVQPVYFQVRFSKPFNACGIALHDVFRPDIRLMRGRNVKGVVSFTCRKGEQIELTVRISDVPFDDTIKITPSFDQVRREAAWLWQQELAKVEIDARDSIKTIFYTALYHTALAPNKLSKPANHHAADTTAFFDEYATLSQWDTYRAAFALNALFRPDVTEGVVGTMLRAAKKNGYLPVWKLWHDDVHCMIGTPSVPILVEAVMKGYAQQHLDEIKLAIIQTMATDNPVAPWSLLDKFGYVPVYQGESFAVSKTLEMAYASACARDFMKQFFPEEKTLIALYERRAKSYVNVFDGFTGFFRGKDAQGQWTEPFDPAITQEEAFVEATPWQYVFHAHHDTGGMIGLHGGFRAFTAKLAALFRADRGKIDAHILDITGLVGQYAHGNEPSHHVAYLYNQAGMPWKTQEIVYDLCTKMYNTSPGGLCGNDDCGQLSAWYVFSALGMYPVHPASGEYQLGVPLVNRASCTLGNGKKLTILVHKQTRDISQGEKTPVSWKYVSEVRLNGVRLTKPVLSHAQLWEGGLLEFTLSTQPEEGAFDVR